MKAQGFFGEVIFKNFLSIATEPEGAPKKKGRMSPEKKVKLARVSAYLSDLDEAMDEVTARMAEAQRLIRSRTPTGAEAEESDRLYVSKKFKIDIKLNIGEQA